MSSKNRSISRLAHIQLNPKNRKVVINRGMMMARGKPKTSFPPSGFSCRKREGMIEAATDDPCLAQKAGSFVALL